MRIATLPYLFPPHEPLYIVGTGPSLRYYSSLDFLRGFTTIGLNQAWKLFPCTYSLTVHPELVVEYEQAEPSFRVAHATRWIVKKKPPLEKLELDDPRYHVFHTAEDWSLFETPRTDTLFLGRGIQCTALDLAARMKARLIVLVGVDMSSLNKEHHAGAQHVQFHGLAPDDVYREYHSWTAQCRARLEKRGIQVLSLQPFLGVGEAMLMDAHHRRRELNLEDLPPPADVSRYQRKRTDSP